VWTYATQVEDQEFTLPGDDGTGLPIAQNIPAGQPAYFQMHYNNKSDKDVQAHVTLNPRSVTANSFGRVDMRVPNERDEAGTKSVVLYFPHGFYSVSTKRVWGWTAKTSMRTT